MKEADDGSFYRRTGNRINEPEKGKVRYTVANLGDQLTDPDQSKISRKQQTPTTHFAGLFLCSPVPVRRNSVDHQSLPRPHPSLSILTLSVFTAFTPGTLPSCFCRLQYDDLESYGAAERDYSLFCLHIEVCGGHCGTFGESFLDMVGDDVILSAGNDLGQFFDYFQFVRHRFHNRQHARDFPCGDLLRSQWTPFP